MQREVKCLSTLPAQTVKYSRSKYVSVSVRFFRSEDLGAGILFLNHLFDEELKSSPPCQPLQSWNSVAV